MKQNLKIIKKFNLALENHKKSNLKAAKELYKEILKIYPNNFETNFFLGTLFLQINNFNEAKIAFTKSNKS